MGFAVCVVRCAHCERGVAEFVYDSILQAHSFRFVGQRTTANIVILNVSGFIKCGLILVKEKQKTKSILRLLSAGF